MKSSDSSQYNAVAVQLLSKLELLGLTNTEEVNLTKLTTSEFLSLINSLSDEALSLVEANQTLSTREANLSKQLECALSQLQKKEKICTPDSRPSKIHVIDEMTPHTTNSNGKNAGPDCFNEGLSRTSVEDNVQQNQSPHKHLKDMQKSFITESSQGKQNTPIRCVKNDVLEGNTRTILILLRLYISQYFTHFSNSFEIRY